MLLKATITKAKYKGKMGTCSVQIIIRCFNGQWSDNHLTPILTRNQLKREKEKGKGGENKGDGGCVGEWGRRGRGDVIQ